MNETQKLIGGRAARAMSGDISESTQRRLIDEGDYPAPVILSRTKLGRPCRVAWVESEVHAWVAKRIALARGITS